MHVAMDLREPTNPEATVPVLLQAILATLVLVFWLGPLLVAGIAAIRLLVAAGRRRFATGVPRLASGELALPVARVRHA